MKVLSVIGIAAMFMVGGGILSHGLLLVDVVVYYVVQWGVGQAEQSD